MQGTSAADHGDYRRAKLLLDQRAAEPNLGFTPLRSPALGLRQGWGPGCVEP